MEDTELAAVDGKNGVKAVENFQGQVTKSLSTYNHYLTQIGGGDVQGEFCQAILKSDPSQTSFNPMNGYFINVKKFETHLHPVGKDGKFEVFPTNDQKQVPADKSRMYGKVCSAKFDS
jgi:hypothetical protein